jgi:CRP/FNR family transcriptional regulator, cyclic AMP receptor protein
MRKVLYLFGQLRDEDIDWLAKAGRLIEIPDGTSLIEQDKEISWLFILVDGVLSVSVKGIGEIDRCSTGDIVGEMSFVSSTLPSADVIAVGRCAVFAIEKTVLAERLRGNTAFASRFYFALAVFLADRLRGTVRRLGYGRSNEPEPELAEYELDEAVLDKVSTAGIQFERFLGLLRQG